MVSIRQTSLKYHGEKAKTYDEIRTKQARWDFEHATVKAWLEQLKPKLLLDCPVGTGRFLLEYKAIGAEVYGYDISEEMLHLAKAKIGKQRMKLYLSKHDATAIPEQNNFFEGSVCVRFLDLIDEDAMKKVFAELARVSKKWIICTIRLGDKYVPKSNTAEHDGKKFFAMVKKAGFDVAEKKQFREGSWHVLLLTRGR